MECNGCDGCGKTYPEIKQIHMCKCFLAAFCTPECFEQSKHKLDCELIDGTWDRVRGKAALTDFSAAVNEKFELIEGPLSRVRGKSDFGKQLSDYTWSLYAYAEATGADKQMKQAESYALLQNIKARDEKRNGDLQTLLKGWNNKNILAINDMQKGEKRSAEAELNQVKGASGTLIAIFKSENRLSLKQRGKNIENAWNAYLQSLREAILNIPKTGEDLSYAYSKFNDTATMAVNVGNVLGGGKDMAK